MSNHTVFGHGDKLNRYGYNSSTEEKGSDSKTCQDLLRKSSVSIRELTQLIGRLTSTAIAVLPATLQYRVMQRQQILELSAAGNYSSEIKLSDEVKTELQWWVHNLHLSNGRSVISYPPLVTNRLRCIFKRLGCILSRTQNKGTMDIIREKR